MKSHTYRGIALATTTVAAAAMLAGCAQGGGAGGAIEVQTNMAAGSDQLAVLTEIAEKFEEQNEGVQLDLIPSSNTYEQDIKVKLASREAPDIWQTHGWSRDRYAQFLAPLQDESWAADVNPLLDSAMRDGDGAIFALPMVADIAGLVYNADVLESAGVDAASLTTWEDFNAAAQTIKDSGVVPIAVSGKANGPAGNIVDWLAPGFFDETALTALQDGEFQADVYETMLDEVAGWVESGFINPDYSSATQDDVAQALGSGQAAFVFSQNTIASDAFAKSPDANLAFMPVPSPDGNVYLIGGEGIAYGVSSASEHLEDAKKFLAFLAEPENQEAFAVASGGAPGLTTATADLGKLQPSYDTWVVENEIPLVPYFDRVYLPNGLWNTLVTTTDSVLTGQASPADATRQVETDFNSLFGQGE